MANFFKTAALATVALSLLAGCSTALPTGLQAKSAGKVRAKLLGYDDVFAVVFNRAANVLPLVPAGMPAVMAAPTDAAAQHGAENLFGQVVSLTMPALDPVLDASMKEAITRELPPSLINTDPEVNAYVQGIADRLSKAKGLPAFKTYVLDNDDWNAFNAGGTSMYVFTGLIKGLRDEAELAGVMAHEMTHGLKRHALQSIVGELAGETAQAWVAKTYPAPKADTDLINATMLTLTPSQRRNRDFVLSYMQGKVSKEAMTNLGFMANAGFVEASMGRKMEAEADAHGARIMAAANYDPYAMADVFDSLNDYPDGDVRYYDHPALGTRVGTVRYQIQSEGLAKQGQERAPERLAAIVAKLNGQSGATPNQLPARFKRFLCK